MAHFHDESDANDWTDLDSDSDSDDFLTISSQVLSEGSDDDIFAYYAGTALSAIPTAPVALGPPTPVIERLKQSRRSTIASARTARTYVDPFIAVKEALWRIDDIDGVVERTLDRMGRAFAYNSVYFLKIVLELQAAYLTMKHRPPASTLLDLKLVLRIAEILSSRLTRKEKDNISLSRELQLRTLVSALTLLPHLDVGKLPGDTYMQLLRDISERDADNEQTYSACSGAAMKSGDNEYLTRYACDSVRGLPADVPPMFEDLEYLNEEATHFLFATGFINQLESRLTPKILESLFARIKASPSPWNADIKFLHEGTMAAISLRHQSLYKTPTQASQFAKALAGEIGNTIMGKLDNEVRMLEDDLEKHAVTIKSLPKTDEPVMSRDTQMFICGLLDLLNQLVGAFTMSKEIVERAKSIAFYLLRNSDTKSFRYKAFEIMISSTVGMGENEYYDTMRNLDFEVESMARAPVIPDTRTDEEKVKAIERVEELKHEKRDAMDRYEKKAILATGAADSIQRRVEGYVARKQGSPNPRPPASDIVPRSLDEVLNQARGCSNAASSISRPYSSATSSGGTLSSVEHSPDSTCSSQSCLTPTQNNNDTWYEDSDGTLSSPTDTGTCKSCCCCSPTETCESATCTATMRSLAYSIQTPLSTTAEPALSPRLSISLRLPFINRVPVPAQAFDLRDAISPGAEEDVTVKMRQLSQLISSPGLMWDPGFQEANDDDSDSTPTAATAQKPRMLSVDLPIQQFDGPPSAIPPPTIPMPIIPPEASMPEVVPMAGPSQQGLVRPSINPLYRRDSDRSMDLPFRMSSSYTASNPSSESLGGISYLNHMVSRETLNDDLASPKSTYPEPSISRPTSFSGAGTLRRQTRTARRTSLHLDKPLPPILVPERSKNSILAENAPEVVSPQPPIRSQSAMDIRSIPNTALRFPGRNNSTLGFRTPQLDRGFTPMDPIEDSNIEYIPGVKQSPINYHEKPLEIAYKFSTKDTCHLTAISRDTRHAVFLSAHSFQVFAIPLDPTLPAILKPKFHYRLGDWEGLKKTKVPWKYKTMAVSDRYVVTIFDERLQVHDLAEDCRVIFNDHIKGWDLTAVDISSDKLTVALSKSLRNRLGPQDIGRIRIYRMNSPTYDGHRYEHFNDRDIFLTDKNLIHPDGPQDSCRALTLSNDGHFLTCATTHFGHYFAWDLSRGTQPRLIAKGQLKAFSGAEGEILTGVSLFPDAQNLLISTFPINSSNRSEFGGAYTQSVAESWQLSVRQVSPRVQHSTISPYGSAAAFLSKNGTVWTTPMEYVDTGKDNILTSFAPTRSVERLGGESSSRIAFSPGGEMLVGVDRRGKCVVFRYPMRQGAAQSAPPTWVAKSELGTTAELGDEEGAVIGGFF